VKRSGSRKSNIVVKGDQPTLTLTPRTYLAGHDRCMDVSSELSNLRDNDDNMQIRKYETGTVFSLPWAIHFRDE
jgi:hypothetical protein